VRCAAPKRGRRRRSRSRARSSTCATTAPTSDGGSDGRDLLDVDEVLDVVLFGLVVIVRRIEREFRRRGGSRRDMFDEMDEVVQDYDERIRSARRGRA